MRSAPIFTTFETWADVIKAVTAYPLAYYHAPLDIAPALLSVVRVYKNGKVRLKAGPLTFTADAGHLSRFRKRTDRDATRGA